MVCAAKGYPFVAVMLDSFSVIQSISFSISSRNRLNEEKSWSFWVLRLSLFLLLKEDQVRFKFALVSSHFEIGMVAKAKELVEQNGWFDVNQFGNPANPEYHSNTTGLSLLPAHRSDSFRSWNSLWFSIQSIGLLCQWMGNRRNYFWCCQNIEGCSSWHKDCLCWTFNRSKAGWCVFSDELSGPKSFGSFSSWFLFTMSWILQALIMNWLSRWQMGTSPNPRMGSWFCSRDSWWVQGTCWSLCDCYRWPSSCCFTWIGSQRRFVPSWTIPHLYNGFFWLLKESLSEFHQGLHLLVLLNSQRQSQMVLISWSCFLTLLKDTSPPSCSKTLPRNLMSCKFEEHFRFKLGFNYFEFGFRNGLFEKV